MVDRRAGGDLGERLVTLETQMKRFISDADSEKETRRRANKSIFDRFDSFDERMRKMEKTIWMASGATGVVVGLIAYLANFLARHV